MKIRKGDHVEKTSGYRWPGIVVKRFRTHHTKQRRFIVECTAEACLGALHIYNKKQLNVTKHRKRTSSSEGSD